MHAPPVGPVVALVVLAGRGSDEPEFRLPEMPTPAHFVARVDNAFYPLPVGATWTCRGRNPKASRRSR